MGFIDSIVDALTLEKATVKASMPKADNDLFEKAVTFVLKEEGGYGHNPRDPGGETKYGITKRSYPHLDIRNLSLDTAKQIYYKDYWLPTGAKIQDIDPYLAVVLFDTAVNMGVPTAIKLLQRAVHVKEDGVIGPITIESVTNNKDSVTERLLVLRMGRYSDLPHWEDFKRGWMSRVIRLSLSNKDYSETFV